MRRVLVTPMVFVLLACQITACKLRQSETSLKDRNEFPEDQCVFESAAGPKPQGYGSALLDAKLWKIIGSNAAASVLAYEEASKIKQTAKEWGFTKVDVLEADSMLAFVMSNEHCAVLSFRGTVLSSLRNLIADVRVSKKRVIMTDYALHTGFYDAVGSLQRQLNDALRQHRVESKYFWVTGHSLGGAMAGVYAFTNALESRIAKGPTIHKIVTFGQPLFANVPLAKDMRKEFLNRYFRVVNDNDIVARIPYRFEHFGSLVWMKQGAVEFDPDQRQYGGNSDQDIIPAAIPAELRPSAAVEQEFLQGISQQQANTSFPTNGRYGEGAALGWPQFVENHLMTKYVLRITEELRSLR